MAIQFKNNQESIKALMEAMNGTDETKIKEAWQGFQNSIADQLRADFEDVKDSNDAVVMAQRGFRQLTSKETKFYNAFIQAMRSPNPKQAFATIIGSDEEGELMPETIIEDVYKHLEESHPLLAAVGVQYTGYTTKWVLNDHSRQFAAWGEINSQITQEINSAFRVIEISQNKLSAFVAIELDMLDLGATFLDAYIRRCLTEALAAGLENGIVNGTGINQPIGLIRDIHEGVSVNSSTGYPAKTKVEVTDFSPSTYGGLVAQLAEAESGRMRNIGKIALLVNPVDYYTKIMPATTMLAPSGNYVNNVLPVPTQIIQSTALAEGDAVLFLPDEYKVFAGGRRGGVIEYSDEYKFLEDMRYFKIKQHATGRAFDDTCALYLDISGLEELYIKVDNKNTVEVEVTTPTL